jgi:hypothetical protein
MKRMKGLIAGSLLLGVLFYFPAGAYCGAIYKWVNEAGHVCYGDSPPATGVEYRIVGEEIKSTPKRSTRPGTAMGKSSPSKGARKWSKFENAHKQFILKRIRETVRSIKALEQELEKNPGDPVLIRTTRMKRQSLEEDFKTLQKFEG